MSLRNYYAKLFFQFSRYPDFPQAAYYKNVLSVSYQTYIKSKNLCLQFLSKKTHHYKSKVFFQHLEKFQFATDLIYPYT